MGVRKRFETPHELQPFLRSLTRNLDANERGGDFRLFIEYSPRLYGRPSARSAWSFPRFLKNEEKGPSE